MLDNLTTEILDKAFFVDGSLRDISIFDVNLDKWQKFLYWVELSEYDIELYIDGEEAPFKNCTAAKLFDEKKHHVILLSINFKGILINCHFFSTDEMAFDIDPKEIKGIVEAGIVIEFMKKLSSIVCKESFLTMENTSEYPLVTVQSDGSVSIF